MDKEKIKEIKTYTAIDGTLNELTKQNKNLESLTNRNDTQTTGTHPEVKPDYYIFIAWCSWFTNYNLTWFSIVTDFLNSFFH